MLNYITVRNYEDTIKFILYCNAKNCGFDILKTNGLGKPLPIFTLSEVILEWVFGLLSGKSHQIAYTCT